MNAIEGVVDSTKQRLKAMAYRMVSRVVAYVAAAVGLVFIVAGVFVWLAREESLVFACLVFAAVFFVVALGGLIGAAVFGKRIERAKSSSTNLSLASVLRNPLVTGYAFRAVGQMRRAPGLVVAAAVAAGLAVSIMNRSRSEQAEA